MSDDLEDRTASLMTPARLAQLKGGPRPAASPAAWLDQLAADAGSGHVRRLVDLQGQLQAQAGERDHGTIAAALGALAGALDQLDHSLVQPRGLLARVTGKGKEAVAAFVAQAGRAVRAGENLADEVRALKKRLQASAPGAERTLLEAEVEVRAIEKIMEQGARWLQDMRNQLKAREAAGGDAAVLQQIRDDTARCELLVVRLKQLRAVSAAAQQAIERGKALAARRGTLLQALQQLVEGPLEAWRRRAEAVAEAARAGGSAGDAADRARSARQDLQSALQQASRDCASLQTREQALAEEVAALQEPLRAAA